MNLRCIFGHDLERLPSPPGVMRGWAGPVRCRRDGCTFSHPGFRYPSAPAVPLPPVNVPPTNEDR